MFCLPSKIFIRIRINYKKWNPDSHQLAWNRHIGAIGSCFSHSFVVPVAPAACLMSSVLWANDYCSSCSGGTLVINLTFAHGPIALDGKNRHEWGPKGTGTNSVGYLAFITGFLLGRIPEMGFLYFKTKHVTVITYLFTIFANIFRSSLQYRPEHISVLGARRFWPLYW